MVYQEILRHRWQFYGNTAFIQKIIVCEGSERGEKMRKKGNWSYYRITNKQQWLCARDAERKSVLLDYY